ncbi:MAG: DUF61 family protein [Chloroflexota bacterium]|nr:DUF61 family protein [Chloroflexota bacterium]
MSGDLHYERVLHECLRGELRIVNAGLPRSRKTLATLLREEYPLVICSDSSIHIFKRRELEQIATILDTDEQEALLLPIFIELRVDQNEASVICQGEVEEKIISRILNMPVTSEQERITIYRPQLALLRKALKTTTQYVFSLKTVA